MEQMRGADSPLEGDFVFVCTPHTIAPHTMDGDQRRRLEEEIERLKKNKIQKLDLWSKCLDFLPLRKLISHQGNYIGIEGAKSLSEALHLNSSLKHLNLHSSVLIPFF